MNNGTYKYNRLKKEQILQLFEEADVINRAHICKAYSCSVYSVRQCIDELITDGVIELTRYGYKESRSHC